MFCLQRYEEILTMSKKLPDISLTFVSEYGTLVSDISLSDSVSDVYLFDSQFVGFAAV